MNYEMMGLIAVYLLNTFILVGILWAQNAKYDSRFDAQTNRIDAQANRIDSTHQEIMELIKKMK